MALILPVNAENSQESAKKILKAGGVIAIPTDTVYGFACDAANDKAIKQLYTIKERNENKPLAICLGEINQLKNWAVVDHLPNDLLENLLPGALTLILKCSNNKLDKSLTYQSKVGIRIPDYQFIRNLATKLKSPLALTSANISSEPSSIKIDEFKILWNKLDGVFDGGDLNKINIDRRASTIVDLSYLGHYKIIRKGAALNKTLNILNRFGLKPFKYE